MILVCMLCGGLSMIFNLTLCDLLDLLESVMNIHVRKGDYEAAKQLSTRFVALSQVKQMELHASFAEFHPIDKRSIK